VVAGGLPEERVLAADEIAVLPPVPPTDLPASLIERFQGDTLLTRIVRVLIFVSEWATSF